MDSLGSTTDEKDKDAKKPISTIKNPPRAVLPSSLTEEIKTESVYVGLIKNRRDTSKAIKLISQAAPGFGHLKRCNGIRLLLAPVAGFHQEKTSPEENFRDPKSLSAYLESKGFDLSLLEEEFEIKRVPIRGARSKSQAKTCSKLWPVNFHPDPTLESLISGDTFTERQLKTIETLMGLVIEAARLSSVGNRECNGGALILDPAIGTPIALSSSKMDEHPLWHAAMLSVDLVAKHQGGGAWNYGDANGGNYGIGAKRKHRDEIPLFYPTELGDRIDIPELEPMIDPKDSDKPENLLESSSSSSSSDKTPRGGGPYLCTNFWVFLSQEPCALCAMALVHSRASKIFYGIDKEFGVLKTKAMLHTVPALNHRYQVWSGVNETECQSLSRDIKIREIR